MTTIQYQGRPTSYNGTLMRSRLEASYAQWLDSLKFTWEYEPMCFATEHGQYLPDFLIRNVDFWFEGLEKDDLYVEVKPKSWFLKDNVDRLTERMRAIPRDKGMTVLAIPGLHFHWLLGVSDRPVPLQFYGPTSPPLLIVTFWEQYWPTYEEQSER